MCYPKDSCGIGLNVFKHFKTEKISLSETAVIKQKERPLEDLLHQCEELSKTKMELIHQGGPGQIGKRFHQLDEFDP